MVVNHSIEFISKDHPEINMQKIRDVMELKREGRSGDNDNMYVLQLIYFHQQKNCHNTTLKQIFPDFLQDIATVYRGSKVYG